MGGGRWEERNKQEQLNRVVTSAKQLKYCSTYEYFPLVKVKKNIVKLKPQPTLFTKVLFACVICQQIQTHNIEFPLK